MHDERLRPRLLLATSNPGKVREIRELLAESGWEIATVRDLGVRAPEVIETARSYLENAVTKAVAFARAGAMPALADDSGLEVDALGGRPGVLSARYGGPGLSDAERAARLLQELADVPAPRRMARFRCVIALEIPGNETMVREGTVEGRIALAPRGGGGFGYDPVFELPDGRTMAEIGAEKQRISHRALALRAMAELLAGLAASPSGAHGRTSRTAVHNDE